MLVNMYPLSALQEETYCVDLYYDLTKDGICPEEYDNYGNWPLISNTEGIEGPYDRFNAAYHYYTTNLLSKSPVCECSSVAVLLFSNSYLYPVTIDICCD